MADLAADGPPPTESLNSFSSGSSLKMPITESSPVVAFTILVTVAYCIQVLDNNSFKIFAPTGVNNGIVWIKWKKIHATALASEEGKGKGE